MRPTTILAGALAALALAPAAASAGTITAEGDGLVVRAAPGELNGVTLGSTDDELTISDSAGYTAFPATCTRTDADYPVRCPIPARVRVELADGNDYLVVDHMVPAGVVVEGYGGDGRDNLKAIAGNTTLTLDGGAGDDTLLSEGGGDVLRGGDGADDLSGGGGADVVVGGPGDDKLTGDVCGPPAADVLDGGPGYDRLTDWGDCGPGTDRRAVTVTVNGVADDGRPGEGDDVRDLDVLELFVPATVTGGDGPESVQVFAPADSAGSTIDGRGGDDVLVTGSSRDVLNGGAGNDRVEGGFGNDTITGGPGRDELFGDATSAQCGGNGQSCTIPFGNDTINARDGEVDQVDCGPGTDRAVVDAADVVAATCETVERPAGGGKPTGTPTGTPTTQTPPKPTTAAGPRMTIKVPGRLKLTLRDGLVVRLTGFKPGAVAVQARLGRKLVAIGRVAVGSGGTATARVRFTRPARRSLARKRAVRLTIKAGSLSRTITVRR